MSTVTWARERGGEVSRWAGPTGEGAGVVLSGTMGQGSEVRPTLMKMVSSLM